MKFSEAILLGMMGVKPGRGVAAHRGKDTRCVLEAALEAIGMPAHIQYKEYPHHVFTNYMGILDAWPWTGKMLVPFPGHREPLCVYQAAMMYFDSGWDTEAVAAWVEVYEQIEKENSHERVSDSSRAA